MRLSPRILGENTEVVCHVLLHRIFPAQGSNSDLLIASGFFSPFEPPGKPKNTGVGSLFLLQGIFPTQELNWGLLHCRWILYQVSYPGSLGALPNVPVRDCRSFVSSPTHRSDINVSSPQPVGSLGQKACLAYLWDPQAGQTVPAH